MALEDVRRVGMEGETESASPVRVSLHPPVGTKMAAAAVVAVPTSSDRREELGSG